MGFVSANQIPQIEQERARRKETIQRINQQEAQYQTTQAWNNYVKTTNLFYQAYALSPAKSGVDAYNDFDDGDYGSAAINTFFTVAGIAELKALGVFGRSGAASIGWGEIWQSSNFMRGTLAESKLARTVYKGYEHLASTVSEFFPAIDFYKDGLGVSLKTVNAKSNFKFEKIFKNIDDLVAAKQGGALQAAGVEKNIKDVRLDIAIPQGYDRSVLKK